MSQNLVPWLEIHGKDKKIVDRSSSARLFCRMTRSKVATAGALNIVTGHRAGGATHPSPRSQPQRVAPVACWSGRTGAAQTVRSHASTRRFHAMLNSWGIGTHMGHGPNRRTTPFRYKLFLSIEYTHTPPTAGAPSVHARTAPMCFAPRSNNHRCMVRPAKHGSVR
jgi:hypothetical protein